MNDPSVTASVRAVVEKHGALMVVLFFLRRYWPAITGVVVAAVTVGVFLAQFKALQTSSDAQTRILQTLGERITHVEDKVDAIKELQTKQESRWNTVTTEAAIVITPKAKPRKR